MASGKVKVTDDVGEAIRESDVSFICVGTPSSPNGSQDLSAIKRVSEQIGAALRGKASFHVVVMRSTIQPGAMDNVVRVGLESASGKTANRDFAVCFQPEFLREGTSIKDYDNPPFTLIGTDDSRAPAILQSLFAHLPCEFLVTSIGVAEMLKYASNAFHAVKITFANEIGRLCQAVSVDAREVMALVCRDNRLNISSAYLRPGFAFGGSCLPKDLRALTYVGKHHDVATPMLTNVVGSNRAHIDHALDLVVAAGSRTVGLLGLSFKPGTDDLRESPLVALAERLIGKGYRIRIYDPEVFLSNLIGANRKFIEQVVPHIGTMLVDDCRSVILESDTIVVGHADSAAREQLRLHLGERHRLIDLTGLPREVIGSAIYSGICW